MMSIRNIVAVAIVGTMFTGCGLYNKYDGSLSPEGGTNGLFGVDVPAEAVGETSLATMSWREFFADPVLQQLIEQVLANNTDLNSARVAVEKSEASLKMARMAYLPSLYFSPQGTLSKFDDYPWSKTYNLPLQLSMDVDLFGSITNKKRASQAVLLQAQVREEAVRANLVSTTAQQYYMLQLLDQQLAILTLTDSLWNASLETQKILWENGKAYSTAVNRMESSYLNVKTQIVDTRRNIRATENALCRLLAIPPQHIDRKSWGSSALRRPWVGIIVSAIIFGLVHMNPVQMVFGFLYGLPLGWLAWRTGSLLPSIVVHVANNASVMLMPAAVDKAIGGMSLTTEGILVAVSLIVLFLGLRWFAQRYAAS